MDEDVLISITVITGAVLIVGHLGRMFRVALMQGTIREAIRRDSPVTDALFDKIEEQQPDSNSDDRTGLVLLAIGAALFCYGLIQGTSEELRDLSGIALFPTFVGAALLGRSLYLNRKGKTNS